MSSWSWCRRTVAYTVALLLVSVSAGCGKETASQQSASAEVRVTIPQGLASADVTGVRVEVRGPGIPAPLSTELLQVGGAWQGTLGNIPAGTERVFEAFAYDAASTVLYQGQSAPLSIGAGATVSVALTLQQVGTPPPYQNVAPVIDSLVVSSNTVGPGGSITLTATASDANGDALSYSWTASAGLFSAPASAATSWQAPATEGVQQLRLEVTDEKGTSTSMSFEVSVQQDGASGSASLSVGFNTWPQVHTMQATSTRLAAGGTTQLSVNVSDSDGDTLGYAWNTGCAGAFDDAMSASPVFTLATLPASGLCSFQVLVSDGRGGQQMGLLVLQTGDTPRVKVAPRIESVWQSATLADGGQPVTLGLTATDPDGTTVAFSWSASTGSIPATRWTGNSSEADWMAPACFDDPVQVTATVTDAEGATARHVFSITPSENAKCGPLAVRGVRNVHHVQVDGSVVSRPEDLSGTLIGAWVPTTDGTGHVYQAGSGQADGTFIIPNVERTPYFLQFGSIYLSLDSRQVDLSHASLGRTDAVEEPQGTRLNYELFELSPYQASDDLQLHSTGAGIGYFTFGCASEFIPPPDGSPLLVGSFDYSQALQGCGNPAARIEPAKGDDLIVSQLVGRTDMSTGSPVEIQELRRSAQVAGLEVYEGSTTLGLRATLQPLATRIQPIDFAASLFESLALASHPNVVLSSDTMYIDTLPRYMEYGSYDGSPDLAIATLSQPGQGSLLLNLEYGNPYPSQWQKFVVAQASAYVPYTLTQPDGSSRTTTISATVSFRRMLMEGMLLHMQPLVGPPRDLTVNGQPATTELVGVGPTPLVSWTAPALGTPDRYVVRVYELFPGGMSGPSRLIKGNFYTTQTQLRLPPGVLEVGRSYALQVYAYVLPGTSLSTPFIHPGDQAYATAVTSKLVP